MPITVSERKNGRRCDGFGGEIEYIVRATGAELVGFDAEDAYDEIANSATYTADFNGLPVSNVVVNEALVDLTTLQVWSVSAIYSNREPTVFDTGSIQYEFSFSAPTGRIYQSLNTRGIYHAGGTYPTTMFGGKIRGQSGDDEGADLPNPAPTNSWTFNIPNGSVSLAYQMGVEAIMGSVNSNTWNSRAADTMRLVGCSGGARNDNDWSIRFEFQFSPNRASVNLGGIPVASIHGHNLVWDYSENKTENTKSVRKPTIIVVEEVFPRANFNALGF
jgi:hypothetical protein